jgi:hypothetical protein
MATWTRRDVLVGGAALSLVGCMPKTPPITASSPTKVVLAGVVAGDQNRLKPLPEGVQRRLVKALEARKLVPTALAIDTLREPFSQKRATPQRLAWLGQSAGEGAMMLVELSAFYDTQIQGRMRWTVQGTLSIGAAADPTAVVQRTIDTAVFLQFLHQAESEAALEAATTIERAADRLLDDWLRAQG